MSRTGRTIPTRKALARMRPYKPPLEGRGGRLRLDFNENTAGCPPAVRRALARISPEAIAMYPEYETAQRRLARFFRVRPEEMLLTNGTDEAIRLVMDAFLEPRETVLLVEPTFALYRFYTELLGGRVRALRYSDVMEFPGAAVLCALKEKPKIFFLANPNNPTGTLLGRDDLRQILRAASQTVVVVDEAYFEFAGITALDRIRRYDNLIVTRTFSKAMGLAGLRLGCLFACKTLADALRKAQPPYSVNNAALVAAQAAIREGRNVRRYAAEVRRARSMVEGALQRLCIPFFPGTGNFILVDMGERAPAALRALRARGVLLRDRRADFGRVGYVRITVGTRVQARRFVRELEQTWRG
jgi:histidinol-phosphate aminotransferase